MLVRVAVSHGAEVRPEGNCSARFNAVPTSSWSFASSLRLSRPLLLLSRWWKCPIFRHSLSVVHYRGRLPKQRCVEKIDVRAANSLASFTKSKRKILSPEGHAGVLLQHALSNPLSNNYSFLSATGTMR